MGRTTADNKTERALGWTDGHRSSPEEDGRTDGTDRLTGRRDGRDGADGQTEDGRRRATKLDGHPLASSQCQYSFKQMIASVTLTTRKGISNVT
jgi:hypothetical protein